MLEAEKRKLLQSLKLAFKAVSFLWLFHLARLVMGIDAVAMGIVPRRLFGLHGIITGPLAHGDWGHLANNSVPLFACITLLFYFFPKIASRSLLLCYVLTGVSVWLLGRGDGWGSLVAISHVGASGVAYALVAFLFWFGVFNRSVQSVVVALVVLLYFSGMIVGVLPDQLNVSWESHLLGGLVGIGVAYLFRGSIVNDQVSKPEPLYEGQPYFPADVFRYTLQEREEMRLAALEAERQRRLEEERRRNESGGFFY